MRELRLMDRERATGVHAVPLIERGLRTAQEEQAVRGLACDAVPRRPAGAPYHDAIQGQAGLIVHAHDGARMIRGQDRRAWARPGSDQDHAMPGDVRSEEHTSELQSRVDLVCRLLLEKK